LHFSPLPKYRGVYAPTWAIINGEKEFGVTLHYMEPVVDKGDIIDQSIFNIEQIENSRALYDVCLEKALNLFRQSVAGILRLENKRMAQDNSQALHYSRKSVDFNQHRINWNTDTLSLTNWIKAYIFPPFQLPTFSWNEKEFEVVSVKPDFKIKKKVELPGTVVSRSGKTFKIATDDSYVIVQTN
jgi:methionyl-tRNA formyltransferase